jgi:hypothetical protein
MFRVIKSESLPKNSKEVNGGQKMTVPDMAEPLDVLLTRFRRGEQINTKRPVFNGDVELPNIKKMDLTEVDAYSRNAKNNINQLNKKGNDIKKEIQKAQYDDKKRKESESKKSDTE